MRVATRRATMSVAPPGAKGTIKVMGRVGNGACCACAGAARRINARLKIASGVRASLRAISKPPRILIASQPIETSDGPDGMSISPVDFSALFFSQIAPSAAYVGSNNLSDPEDPSHENLLGSIWGVEDMDDWNAALRLTSVFAVIAFIALAASVYEIDRREKSSTDTVVANLADLDQQVQLLSNRVRILGNQYAGQLTAEQRQLQALTSRIEALSKQYDAKLAELENILRARR